MNKKSIVNKFLFVLKDSFRIERFNIIFYFFGLKKQTLIGILQRKINKTVYCIFLFFVSCKNYGQLKLVTHLPKALTEVSGTQVVANSNLIWMLNDSGNKPELFGVSAKGKIKKVLQIQAKNNDWEDLTSDSEGNVYIADFGNNLNKRKNLVILKISKQDLQTKKNVEVERIYFKYPKQTKFPPKKKKLFFDAESLLYFQDSLYIFTKTRSKHIYGKTDLYKIPAKKGNHIAKFIASFNTGCNKIPCWVTSAAISSDNKKVALLTHNKVLLFTNFSSDNFFNGDVKKYYLGFTSQKESVTFKDKNTLYITDEKAQGRGRNLYKFSLNN